MILMLALMLTLTANMAKADDFSDGLEAALVGDYATALKLWKPLAESGDAEAQYNLGWMYDNGYGLLQDHKRAHMWYNISRSNGEKEHAGDNIEVISRIMSPSDILKAQDMARKCVDSGYQDC